MPESTSKRCIACGEQFPLLGFYKYKRSADGRMAVCATCFRERRARRRAMTPEDKAAERRAVEERAEKTCTGCGQTKPRVDFRVKRGSRDRMAAKCKACEAEWHRRHYEANRERLLAASRAWYEENRERRLAVGRAYYEANREQFAERQRRWAAANPGARARLVREWKAANAERDREIRLAWRAANRERLREQSRRAYAANPEKFILRAHERRARVAQVTVGPVDLEALWTGFCGLCDQPLDRELAYPDPLSKSLDHIYPLSRGGTHEQANLQWAHLRCNVAKGARLPDELQEVS